PLAEKPGWFSRVWERVTEEVALGRQVFVVCAAIDAAAKEADPDAPGAPPVEGEKERTRWGVVQVQQLLARDEAYRDIRVEILHGKMPADQKDGVMQAFSRGEIDVLVATTVVEVGV